jgi:ABC-2 type transport system ATP-binding protein
VAIVDHGQIIAHGSPAELIAQLGGENIVDFTLAQPAPPLNEVELAQLPAVRSARVEGETYSLAVTQPHVALPAILALLQGRGLVLSRLTTRHATLEDVFVARTGRHLEEQTNGKP